MAEKSFKSKCVKGTVHYFDIWAKSLDYGSLNTVL